MIDDSPPRASWTDVGPYLAALKLRNEENEARLVVIRIHSRRTALIMSALLIFNLTAVVTVLLLMLVKFGVLPHLASGPDGRPCPSCAPSRGGAVPVEGSSHG